MSTWFVAGAPWIQGIPRSRCAGEAQAALENAVALAASVELGLLFPAPGGGGIDVFKLRMVAALIVLGAAGCSSHRAASQPNPGAYTAKLHDLGCTTPVRNDGHDVWTASDGSQVAACRFTATTAGVEVHVYNPTSAKLVRRLASGDQRQGAA
jgi:hypothetical protein